MSEFQKAEIVCVSAATRCNLTSRYKNCTSFLGLYLFANSQCQANRTETKQQGSRWLRNRRDRSRSRRPGTKKQPKVEVVYWWRVVELTPTRRDVLLPVAQENTEIQVIYFTVA